MKVTTILADSHRSNRIAIFCAIGAAFFFTLNDVAIKFISGDYALHQIVLFRMSLTVFILMPLEGGWHNLKTKRLAIHVARGLSVVIANMLFFLGLAAMPLADATAIFFVSPLIITLFSILFLGEKVGAWRWLAVAAGLVGVVIMMRPGSESFQFAALFPVLAAAAYATLHILTRKMRLTENASTMTFYIQLVFVGVSLAMGAMFGDGRYSQSGDPSIDFLLRAWVWPKAEDWAILAFLGLASVGGGYFISQAYRLGEASIIAPYEYTGMPMAILWSVLVFSQWPDLNGWIGIILIISSGLLVYMRERQAKIRLRR